MCIRDRNQLAQLLKAPDRLRVIRIPIHRELDVDQHRRLAQAVATALSEL